MRRFKQNVGMMLTGMALGAVLTGGAFAAGIVAEPAWSPIYVDGQQVQMTAYNILGNNYVKLRDIGQAVGFNVYWDNGVQVDSDAPYTGEAPAVSTAVRSVRVGSYKGNPLKTGDRSGLIIGPSGTSYTVTSSNPAVIAIENVAGNWVAAAKAVGSATITATDSAGNTGTLVLTVTGAEAEPAPSVQASSTSTDLSANMEARQEMIRLINQVRRENGAADLVVNESLMNAAQDCAAQRFTTHQDQYECETAMAYGYPHGFGSNLTAFTGTSLSNTPSHAVQNWINSSGHFQTMVAERYDTIGVGIYHDGQAAYCFMFVGNPDSIHLYG